MDNVTLCGPLPKSTVPPLAPGVLPPVILPLNWPLNAPTMLGTGAEELPVPLLPAVGPDPVVPEPPPLLLPEPDPVLAACPDVPVGVAGVGALVPLPTPGGRMSGSAIPAPAGTEPVSPADATPLVAPDDNEPAPDWAASSFRRKCPLDPEV